MMDRQFELELAQLNCKWAELKEKCAKMEVSNDRIAVALDACSQLFRTLNETFTKATILNNVLIDQYEMHENYLNAAIEKMNQNKAGEEQSIAYREKESKILDDEIDKAEREIMELVAKSGQLDMIEAESKKEAENLRAQIKMLETEAGANPGATYENNSENGKNVETSELHGLQDNLTQSDKRLMDIHGIEQTSFLDRYFLDAAKIKQERVSE